MHDFIILRYSMNFTFNFNNISNRLETQNVNVFRSRGELQFHDHSSSRNESHQQLREEVWVRESDSFSRIDSFKERKSICRPSLTIREV